MPVGDRMVGLVACMAVAALTSGHYAFSVFSGALKEQLQLTQGDLDAIGAYPYLAGLLSWVPGLLNDRAGPRAAVAAGCCGMSAALVLYWAVATRRLELDIAPATTLASIMCIVQWSNCGISAGVFSSLVKNFPLERGVVSGIAKAWIGLSSGVLTQLYVGFIGVPDNTPETLNFVLVMGGAAFVAGICPAMLIVIHPLPKRAALTPSRLFCKGQHAAGIPELWVRFGGFYLIVFATAGLITASSLAGGGRSYAVAIVVALLSPILFAMPWPTVEEVCSTINTRAITLASSSGEGSVREQAPKYSPVSLHEEFGALDHHQQGQHYQQEGEERQGMVAEKEGRADRHLPEIPTTQVVRTADCWLLLLGICPLVGGGQLLNININQMCEARAQGEAAVAVTLFSVGNGLGRVVSSSLSDWAHRRHLFPRTTCLVILSVVMCTAHLLMALPLEWTGVGGFYTGVFVAAGSFGGTFPLTVVITSELFGLKHHGANYMMFDGAIQLVGTLGFGKLLAQTVYTDALSAAAGMPVAAGGPVTVERVCYGAACFAGTHWVTAGLSAAGAMSVACVSRRSKRLYDRIWDSEECFATN